MGGQIMPSKEELCEFEKAIEHRYLLEKNLKEAKKVVTDLENDITTIAKVWPSEKRVC